MLADKPFGEWNQLPHPPGRRAHDGLAERQAGRRQRPPGELLEPQAAAASQAARSSSRPTAARSAGATSSSARFPPTRPTAILRKHGPAGFEAVFNGKDFDGWAGPIDNYEVKDGAIVCKPKKGGTIYTKEEYADFVARLEFKLPPGGNNGLAIRYPGKGDTAYVGMCELQVLDDNCAQVRQARSAPGPRLGLRHGRRAPRLPAPDRRVELPGSHRQGLDDQGRTERHRDPRRRPEQGHRVHGQQPAPGQGPHQRRTSASPATATRSRSATSRSRSWRSNARSSPVRPGSAVKPEYQVPRKGNQPMSKSLITRRAALKTLAAAGLAAPFAYRLHAAAPSETLYHASFGAGGMAAADIGSLTASKHRQARRRRRCRPGPRRRDEETLPRRARSTRTGASCSTRRRTSNSVNVSTPDHMHAPITMWAMQQGLHVYTPEAADPDIYEARQLTRGRPREEARHPDGHPDPLARGPPHGRRRSSRTGAIGKVKEVHTWSGKKWGDRTRGPTAPTPCPPASTGTSGSASRPSGRSSATATIIPATGASGSTSAPAPSATWAATSSIRCSPPWR